MANIEFKDHPCDKEMFVVGHSIRILLGGEKVGEIIPPTKFLFCEQYSLCIMRIDKYGTYKCKFSKEFPNFSSAQIHCQNHPELFEDCLPRDEK